MIDVVEIKKAIKDKEIEFYIGGNRIYCRSDNGDTIQVLDLAEHDKQIRTSAIDEFVEQIRVYYALKQELGYVATTYEDLIKVVFDFSKLLKEQNK